MSEEYRAKVFKSGNSVALRLPKALGYRAGDELRIVREEQAGFKVEPVARPAKLIDLTGIAGALPHLKLLTPEERLMQPRELDWEGKLLPRD